MTPSTYSGSSRRMPRVGYAWQQLVVLADVAELNPELIDTVEELRVSEINAQPRRQSVQRVRQFRLPLTPTQKRWIARSVRRCLACVEAGAAADADKNDHDRV